MATVTVAEIAENVVQFNGRKHVRFRYVLDDATEHFRYGQYAAGDDLQAILAAKSSEVLQELASEEATQLLGLNGT